MAVRRTPKPQAQTKSRREKIITYGEFQRAQEESQLRIVSRRPKLDHLLRSRCRVAFVIISILAMLVVVRSGINASRGYALVATQNQAEALEQENERLRIEIAKLKAPSRIKQIAEDELGMDVPRRMYFSHEH